jgi:thiamine biosynthesis lipoprotein
MGTPCYIIKFESMGTVLEVQIFDEIQNGEIVEKKIREFTKNFDETYSRFNSDSLVSKISASSGTFSVPREFTQILKLYIKLNELTLGAVNPLIGNTISDLGYDANYSLQRKESIRSSPDLNQTLKIIDETTISTSESVLIDIGAIGKGYWVDKVAEILNGFGIKKYLVNGSGDIYYKSENDVMRVGLESPITDGKVIGYTEVQNQSICCSGTKNRAWGDKLHHIINANNSAPTENYLSIWTITKSAMLSDALATALFFVSPDKLSVFDFEYLSLDSDNKIKSSAGFNLKLVP